MKKTFIIALLCCSNTVQSGTDMNQKKTPITDSNDNGSDCLIGGAGADEISGSACDEFN